MAYLHVNGIDLYVEIYGEGTPLVCLHGNGEDHTTFSALGATLSKEFKIHAFDTRGHGRSTMVTAYHYADMAQDIAMALEELFEGPVDLLGFSDGGIIALFLAIWFPHLVRRMIICGANYHPYGIREEGRLAMQQEYDATGNPLMPLMLQEPWLTRKICTGYPARYGWLPANTISSRKHTPGNWRHICPMPVCGSWKMRITAAMWSAAISWPICAGASFTKTTRSEEGSTDARSSQQLPAGGLL